MRQNSIVPLRSLGTRAVSIHSGRCEGHCFSKKWPPFHPVRVALQRQRAVVQVGQQHTGDAHVVVDQVALREAGGGIEDLVEVGQPQGPALDLHLHPALAPRRRHRTHVEEGAVLGHRQLAGRRRLTRRGGILRQLQADLPRVLVRAQALVGRVSQHPLSGQLAVVHLGDQIGVGEAGAPLRLAAAERRVLAGPVPKQADQLAGLVPRKAGADLAREAQVAGILAGVLVVAGEQGAQLLVRSLLRAASRRSRTPAGGCS